MSTTADTFYYLDVTVKVDLVDGTFGTEKYRTSAFEDYDDAIDEAERLITGGEKLFFNRGKVWNVDIIECTVTEREMRAYI